MDRKIREKVFDKPTLMAIYYFFTKGIFREIGSPVADGKEARVFIAKNDRDLAVKIYKIEASSFENFKKYIRGDPRFWHVGNNRRAVINAWVKKEFGNLRRLYGAGVSCPKPLAFSNNVLVMEFIGEGIPAPHIKDVKMKDPEGVYRAILEDLRKAYQIANLVHADLSEYNILFWEGKHYIIDVGQAVDIKHPKADEFLKRDAENLANFFSEWVNTNPGSIITYIKEEQKG